MFNTLTRNTLALAGLMTIAALPLQASAAQSGFTEEQQQQIGQIASDYIIQHPEVLQKASQAYQQQQQQQATQQLTTQSIANADALINDKDTPSYGPAKAKVAVVEFFDYQCIYCAQTAPQLEQVIKSNPDVRFVFKEFPVFGQRWPASIQAAIDGLTVYKHKGQKGYLAYHNAVYATGKNEGKLQDSDTAAAAAKVGVTKRQLADNKVDAETWLNKNMSLAQTLGIMGTPTLIIMPTQGANENNVTAIPGAASQQTIEAAIKKAAQ